MEAQLSKLTESLNQMNEIQRDNSDNSRKLFRLLDNLETSFLNMEIGGLEETGSVSYTHLTLPTNREV